MRQKEEATLAVGWRYLWDVARMNGLQYIPGAETQKAFFVSLVQGCTEQDADNAHLAANGEKQYWYAKRFGNTLRREIGKHICLKADAQLKDAMEFKALKETMGNAAAMQDTVAAGSLKRAKSIKASDGSSNKAIKHEYKANTDK